LPQRKTEPQAAVTPSMPARRGLSDLSKQVVVVWLLACGGLPLAILLPAPELKTSLAVFAAAGTIVGLAVGIAYARHWRPAWYLVQAGLLAVIFLAGYSGHRWLFVGASFLMIYLYFSLYTAEVRAEFEVHAAPREIGVLLVLLGMCALLAIVRSEFLEGGNLLDLARQFSMVGIMAVGMTMVIVLGGIDLSVGSVVALSGCLATLAIRSADCSLLVAILIAAAAGAAVGLFNGALISVFRMPPFVITLGTMSMARSLAIVVTRARQVTVRGAGAEAGFHDLAQGYLLGVPNPVWIMALVVLAGHVFLAYTRTGRHVYYIGANEAAARLSGLNVAGIKLGVYTVCGLLAGLAGMVQASRVATGQPTVGIGDELRVIAAVIVGGASFSGGAGTVLGALLGAAIMGVLSQGLILLGVEANWKQFVEGAVIIGAVALDMLRRRR
jgi:ribose/xylose/arabinose/galactoside ABC-type transport system permease subunit